MSLPGRHFPELDSTEYFSLHLHSFSSRSQVRSSALPQSLSVVHFCGESTIPVKEYRILKIMQYVSPI